MSRAGKALFAFVFLVLLLGAPQAALAAGSYEIGACNYAGGINESWIWSSTDPSSTDHYTAHVNCPYYHGSTGGNADQEGGLSITDTLGLSSGAPPNTHAAWKFTAPLGTTISSITYQRYFGHDLDPDNYWSPALTTNGTILEGLCEDTVANGEGCYTGGPPGVGVEPATITGLDAHELSFGITCNAPAGQECITGATEHQVWAAMYGATVTINDPTTPTLTTPTGPLWEPGKTNGYHKGTETVTISAQDTGGGVQTITLLADGDPIETYQAPCNYMQPKPCPTNTGPQAFTLPTTSLPDGTHTLTLLATNAAGNQSQIATTQIVIDNSLPPPPTDLIATPTQPNGTTFTVTWADQAEPIAPITGAIYQICPVSDPGECNTPVSAPPAGPVTVTLPGAGIWTLSVWLTNAAGDSSYINAAYVTLIVPPPSAEGSGQADSTSKEASPGRTSDPGKSSGVPNSKTALHITAALHGHKLIIRIGGPVNQRARVSFTGTLRGRRIAYGVKTVTLRRSKLTVVFTLGSRITAHTVLSVSIRLDHGAVVTSIIRRGVARHTKGTDLGAASGSPAG